LVEPWWPETRDSGAILAGEYYVTVNDALDLSEGVVSSPYNLRSLGKGEYYSSMPAVSLRVAMAVSAPGCTLCTTRIGDPCCVWIDWTVVRSTLKFVNKGAGRPALTVLLRIEVFIVVSCKVDLGESCADIIVVPGLLDL